MRRVLVTGGRRYHAQDLVDDALEDELARSPTGMVLIHGGAAGADACAAAWARGAKARGMRVDIECYSVSTDDWRRHGKKAGPLRNARMVKFGHPDVCIAFPGGPGTADCARRAKAAGVEIILVLEN